MTIKFYNLRKIYTSISVIILFISLSHAQPGLQMGINEITLSNLSSSEVNLYVHYHSVDLGNLVSSDVQITNQDINVELCYFPGVLSTPISLYDDFVLTLPNSGSFNLNITVYHSSFGDTCQIMDTIYSRTINFDFPFSQPITLSNDVIDQITELELYPNPTTDKIYLKTPASAIIEQINLFDLTGRKVREFAPIGIWRGY